MGGHSVAGKIVDTRDRGAERSRPATAGGTPAWSDVRQEILREHGPGLRRMLADVRRQREVMRLVRALARPANRFCARVRAVRSGGPDTHGYGEAGRLVERYLDRACSVDDLLNEVNRHLEQRPRYWRVTRQYVGRAKSPRISLDRGAPGPGDDGQTNAWQHLAELLDSGATLDRFRRCVAE